MQASEILSLLQQEITSQNLKQYYDALRFLNQKYYDDSEQVVSDKQYDELFAKTKQFEENNPNLAKVDSPTQQVAQGIAMLTEGAKIKHLEPMLSLANSYNDEDLLNFDKSIKKELGLNEYDYYVEPKYDGSSISLVYENDHLYTAATRGNGIEGDDITENAKRVKNILTKVPFSSLGYRKVEIRGEVVIERHAFEKLNNKREEEGLAIFQNPRNTASGTLRIKTPEEIENRKLEAFIYNIGYLEASETSNRALEQSQSQNIHQLKQLGFNSADGLGKQCKDIFEVIEFCKSWEEKREHFGYDIDGMVIKVNSISHQNMLGSTSHHPKWAIALKFKAIEKPTKLLDIEYQIGRTGIISPVAKVEPVKVGGVTISSISLHNEDFIQSKDLKMGDIVFIERAGDVIPQLVRVDIMKRTGMETPISYIKNCPSCQSRIVRNEGEAAWRCVNATCPAQQIEKIIYFASKEAMNIKGLGKDIIKRFVEEGIIKEIADIYQLDYQRIEKLEGWKERSIQNLKNSIEESKSNELHKLIVSLGIPNVGNTMSKILAKKVESIYDFNHWTIQQYIEIEDVGEKMAQSLFDYFQNQTNIQFIEKLEHFGVNVQNQNIVLEGPLLNQIIVFTGFRNAELEQKIEKLGGQIGNSLSKKTTILVVKEKGSGSSKETKAQQNGTEIMTIEEFEIKYINP